MANAAASRRSGLADESVRPSTWRTWYGHRCPDAASLTFAGKLEPASPAGGFRTVVRYD